MVDYKADELIDSIRQYQEMEDYEGPIEPIVETQLRRPAYNMDPDEALQIIDKIEEAVGFRDLCDEYREKVRQSE